MDEAWLSADMAKGVVGTVVLEDTLWLESEGSELPSRGVMYPPPSTAIGIMNSRGLFLMGCDDWDTLALALALVVVVVVVVSDSESLVDWRDNESADL